MPLRELDCCGSVLSKELTLRYLFCFLTLEDWPWLSFTSTEQNAASTVARLGESRCTDSEKHS